jgi:hypothetical protein
MLILCPRFVWPEFDLLALGYIFDTKLIETLALKFFPVALFQNDTLQCLSEVLCSTLSGANYCSC